MFSSYPSSAHGYVFIRTLVFVALIIFMTHHVTVEIIDLAQ